MLYLVGTPIGNLGDFSPRAVEVLKSVDLIACEDTRRTGLLLSHFGIENRLMSYHEHNKVSHGQKIMELLIAGQNVALVSDAGMPSISDPGEDLASLAAENDIPLTVIPGPVAGITALVLSGMDARHYYFEGFLPSEGKARKARISAITSVPCTTILYEAPHRLIKTLEELSSAGLCNRKAAACRELTKKYEEVIRGTVNELLSHFNEIPPKGEFVLVLEACPEETEAIVLTEEERKAKINALINAGMSTKDIAKFLSEEWKENKKSLYAEVLQMVK